MADTPSWQVPLSEECYMVGQRHAGSLLQCNTYLRSFRAKRRSPIHWCVDPGSQIDYPAIRKHLIHHIGEISAIRLFSINHQDPDVVGNLIYLTKENEDLTGIASEDTWRLVRHLNVHPRNMHFTNKVGWDTVTLPDGHKIYLVPTPFCHFRGAVAYFDPESQILFSGDLFGGLNKPGRVQLVGDEEDWAGIAQFHQIYMPTRTAVAFAIRQIRALRPAVKMIAPQHGFVLLGDFMHTVMDRLQALPVGMDLLPKETDERYFQVYADIVAELVRTAAVFIGQSTVLDRLRRLPKHHALHHYLKVKSGSVELARYGIAALPLVVDVLSQGLKPESVSMLKTIVLEGCTRHKAPLPQIGIGIEDQRQA